MTTARIKLVTIFISANRYPWHIHMSNYYCSFARHPAVVGAPYVLASIYLL